jgi:hypothetical protein
MSIRESETQFRQLLRENAEMLMDWTGDMRVFDGLSRSTLFSEEERADMRKERHECRRGVVRCLAAIFSIRQHIADCVSLRRRWEDVYDKTR